MNRRAGAAVPATAVERFAAIGHIGPVTRPLPFRLAAITLVATAGCVPRADPPVPVALPAPVVAPPPAPPAPVVDWQDREWTPGAWRYARESTGSRATYAVAGQPAAAELRCDKAARMVVLSRPGAIATPFTIRTSATTRSVAAAAVPGAVPQVMARFAPDDRLLDAMAFTRGRFVVEQGGAIPLILPPWAEVGRVIEDCRG